jgi:hypothetical protein
MCVEEGEKERGLFCTSKLETEKHGGWNGVVVTVMRERGAEKGQFRTIEKRNLGRCECVHEYTGAVGRVWERGVKVVSCKGWKCCVICIRI